MNRSNWAWSLLAALTLGLTLSTPGMAQEKPKKEEDKIEAKTIVIQIDASKLPPDVLKQLLSLGQQQGTKVADKKPEQPEVKKPEQPEVKKPEVPEKREPQKAEIVQVDLSKLSPELAKQLKAELAKLKGKEGEKDDDNNEGKKSKKGDNQKGDKDDKKNKDEKDEKDD